MIADLLTSAALGGTSVLGISPPPHPQIGITLNTHLIFFIWLIGDRFLVQRLLLLSTLAMKCESTKMYSDAIDSLEPITYQPIGVIESPYMQRFGWSVELKSQQPFIALHLYCAVERLFCIWVTFIIISWLYKRHRGYFLQFYSCFYFY